MTMPALCAARCMLMTASSRLRGRQTLPAGGQREER